REQDLFPSGSPLLLLVTGLQDPGNLGTVLRSAEAFGVTGIILTRSTVSPYNAKVVRATAGAVFRIPMLRNLTAAEAVALLRRRRVRLFSSVVRGGRRLSEIDCAGPMAVAIGSEGAGLPQEISAAGRRLTIPMAAAVESLNAATAAAVILYEIARQRNSG
ncbi:MAG: RNA methyltransferase, partial [Acidobacteria bacterium]|nr:RNA methyltransferase [Acidobacteriota bacterium]